MRIDKCVRVLRMAALLAGAVSFGQPAQAEKEPIRIGIATSVTGFLTDIGGLVTRAIVFAVDEANKKGGIDGRKVEYRIYDTEAKPELARKQVEKLASEGFNLIMGSTASGESLAIAPMLERWDALYISTVTGSNQLSGTSCTARMFRANRTDANDRGPIRAWLGDRKEKKWATLAADVAWGRDSAAGFTAIAKEKGKEVVTNLYTPSGTNDFAPYIQQLRDAGIDGLWITLAGRDGINFVTQASQFGMLDQVTVAGVGFMTDTIVNAIGQPARRLQGIIGYSSMLDTPENKAFVDAYRAYYNGQDPAQYQGETYVGTQILFEAIRRAGSVKPVDIAKQIEGGTFDTIQGKLTVRAQDHQIVVPNYFGYVGELNGRLKPTITIAVDAAAATPPINPDCKMGELK